MHHNRDFLRMRGMVLDVSIEGDFGKDCKCLLENSLREKLEAVHTFSEWAMTRNKWYQILRFKNSREPGREATGPRFANLAAGRLVHLLRTDDIVVAPSLA